MVIAGQSARGQQHHQEQGGRGEADDDGGQHQRLRQRIGVMRDGRKPVPQYGVGAAAQAADGEDEQIDGIGHQRQPDDDLKRARSQYQPGAGTDQHPDGKRQYPLHQRASSSSATVSAARTGRRRVWCASTTGISELAPATTPNTPKSNSKALLSGMSPSSGTVT